MNVKRGSKPKGTATPEPVAAPAEGRPAATPIAGGDMFDDLAHREAVGSEACARNRSGRSSACSSSGRGQGSPSPLRLDNGRRRVDCVELNATVLSFGSTSHETHDPHRSAARRSARSSGCTASPTAVREVGDATFEAYVAIPLAEFVIEASPCQSGSGSPSTESLWLAASPSWNRRPKRPSSAGSSSPRNVAAPAWGGDSFGRPSRSAAKRAIPRSCSGPSGA